MLDICLDKAPSRGPERISLERKLQFVDDKDEGEGDDYSDIGVVRWP